MMAMWPEFVSVRVAKHSMVYIVYKQVLQYIATIRDKLSEFFPADLLGAPLTSQTSAKN